MIARALRILLVANDGFSAGHVTRAVAIAGGLTRRAVARGLDVRIVLATTSAAEPLLRDLDAAVVRLPAPGAARAAGFTDAERRRLVRSTIDGLVEGFAPDVVVADTFPNGPHGELGGIGRRARRVIVRRDVIDERAEPLAAGLAEQDLAIVAGDPHPLAVRLGVPTVQVPPITLDASPLDREAARRVLDLPPTGRAILVAAGGGGDADAVARAADLAGRLAASGEALFAWRDFAASGEVLFAWRDFAASGEVFVVHALGPLAPVAVDAPPGVRTIRRAPLQPLLAAFDGAVCPAGYNTTYELARARVPAVLFAQPRPFDDQAGRAARMAAAGFARVLDDDLAAALAWIATARLPELPAGGADRAADAILDLGTGVGGVS